jgi:DNA-binding GntR family transcriptional regulator
MSRGPRLVELLEVRRVLESAATAPAAARITPDRLAEVDKHLTAISDNGRRPATGTRSPPLDAGRARVQSSP